MRIILKNEYGKFEMGGGSHPTARIIEMQGFGIVGKETQSVVFEGQPGKTTTNVRDVDRTITISLDFYGGQREVENLYQIISNPVDILCFFGDRRRKTLGRCINATDVTSIIYHRWYSVVLQFVCDDPYFHDVNDISLPVMTAIDMLPNEFNAETGEWKVSLPAIATTISNRTTVTNKGDMNIYPVITMSHNSAVAMIDDDQQITIENESTGARIVLNYIPSASETVTVDLKRRRITSNQNGNITACISDDTVLSNFYLAKGDNVISGAISDENLLVDMQITYTNNYISAVM